MIRKIFQWIVRAGDNSTEVRSFRQTRTGEFVEHHQVGSRGRVDLDARRAEQARFNSPSIPTDALRHWREHSAAKPRAK